MRKPRSDSILDNLPTQQKEKLCSWLLEGMSYNEARRRVKDQFGIELKSLKSFSMFYHTWCTARILNPPANSPTAASHGIGSALKSDADFAAKARRKRLFDESFLANIPFFEQELVYELCCQFDNAKVAGIISLRFNQVFRRKDVALFLEFFTPPSARSMAEKALSSLLHDLRFLGADLEAITKLPCPAEHEGKECRDCPCRSCTAKRVLKTVGHPIHRKTGQFPSPTNLFFAAKEIS